ncbi:endoglucanase 1 precursor [Clostridium puniceum]|uniref:Endoglucanase 1 n=1 Tax=Clostridium puniceum TaxID=29367 RepID=A0A1S8THQ2_9CLOT|nr:glycoside hydrolase family 9 protein [Clostridium puniceum]OOM77149.1 endoglucanase 1 precursor [Clostridium puniceum]
MNFNKIKKVLALLTVASMFSTGGFAMPVNAETTDNYAKALQLSLYFYDANQCGNVSGTNRLTYRGDCHLADEKVPLIPKSGGKGTNLSASFIAANKNVLDPDENGSVDLSGGYHDCGDHVKFGMTQGYSGSTLGWGYYEFKNSYAKIGEQDHIENILRWFNDYFMRCTFRDANGNVVAFAYQVGDGNTDHGYWGAPELQATDRPAWFATAETPASDQCAEAAASLAVNYMNFKDSDLVYANKCLDTAKALYKFAKNNRGIGFSGGFYNSGYDEDDLSWAAAWLNRATGDKSYLNDVIATDSSGNYTGYLKKTVNNKSWNYRNSWVHCWDNVWAGVYGILAPITNDSTYWNEFRWNAEYWSGVTHQDNSGGYLNKTSGGYSFLNQWGSARYNTAAQLCALIYNKYKPNAGITDWSKKQMNYLLGNNPLNRSYEVGYSEKSVKYPHHRASHGSTTNKLENPVESKHTLWGALVGGPDGSDNHIDSRGEYVSNEVGIDYNAGFVGALAGLYEIYGEGQQPLSDIPEVIKVKGDTQAPTAPSNLSCDRKTANSVTLLWTSATDNVGVTSYDIYNGSTLVGTSQTSSYTVTGLNANTTYSFTIKAKDAANNISLASSPLSVTTSSDDKLLLGDVNGDGEIDMLDYMELQKYISFGQANNINKQNSDINGDTRINTADLFALRKIILNDSL